MTNDREPVNDPRQAAQSLFDFRQDLIGPFERVAFRSDIGHLELALIVARDQVDSQVGADRNRRKEDEHADNHRDNPVPQRPGEDCAIERVDRPIDESPLGLMTGVGGIELQKVGTQHRCEGERHKQAHDNRKRDGQSEAAEKPAHDPAHEGNRNEDNDQGEARGENGERDFPSPVMGSGSRVLPEFLHMPKNVLMNDHGVINHDADRENQRQHRDVVQRKTHVVHEEKRWNDRCRNGERRNDRGPPVPDEQQDRGRNQDGGEQQVKIHFGHRFANEAGLILNNLDLDVRGKRLLDPRQSNLDRIRDRHGIGPRLPLHEQADGVLSVEATETSRFFDRILGPANILDANRMTTSIGDNQFVELGRCLHPSERPQDELSRTLADDAPWNFHVLSDQRLPDILNGKLEGCELFCVDDHIDGSVPSSRQTYGADPRDGLQLFLNLVPGNFRHFTHIAATRDTDGHDRRGVEIKPIDHRRIHPLRQLIENR